MAGCAPARVAAEEPGRQDSQREGDEDRGGDRGDPPVVGESTPPLGRPASAPARRFRPLQADLGAEVDLDGRGGGGGRSQFGVGAGRVGRRDRAGGREEARTGAGFHQRDGRGLLRGAVGGGARGRVVLEGLGHVAGAGEAIGRVLGDHPPDDRVEPGRDVGRGGRERVGIARLVGQELLGEARGRERDVAGDHMIERAAERVDVAPGVDVPRVAGLLGGDVVESPDRRAIPRDVDAFLVVGVDGEAQVGELGRPVAVNEDVHRVDVAVQEPLDVEVLQSVGDLGDQGGGEGPGGASPACGSSGRSSAR